MMSDGLPNREPSPVAEALGLEPDAPLHHAEISEKQATDGLYHALKVLVELSTTTPRRPIRPIGFVFMTNQVSGRQSDERHEIGAWLKRRYLKKEWRSAEFSGGVLKKKGKAP